MRIMLLALLISLPTFLIAQSLDSVMRDGWYLKINTFSVFDVGAPTIQVGIENKLNSRRSFETTIGIPLRIKKQLKNTDSTYVNFYKVKTEIKFFSAKKQLRYFSLEAFYTRFGFDDYAAFFFRQKTEYAAEYAEFKRSIYGAAVKPGWLMKSKRTGKINSEYSIGFGIRSMHTTINDLNSVMVDHNHFWIATHPKEGWKITPHLSVAVKIFLKL